MKANTYTATYRASAPHAGIITHPQCQLITLNTFSIVETSVRVMTKLIMPAAPEDFLRIEYPPSFLVYCIKVIMPPAILL